MRRAPRSTAGWILALSLLGAPIAAQPAAQPAPAATPAADHAAVSPAAPFDVEAATEAYLARMSPAERARSDAYFEGGYWYLLWDFLYGLAVAWLLLGSGFSAKLRDAVARAVPWRPLQTFLYAAGYILAVALLTFPLTLWEGFFREHRYGLSNQTFPSWLRDFAVGLGVSVPIFGLLLTALYAVLRRAPRTWWIWGSAVALAFLLIGALIAPVYIAPLFNKYTPLPDSPLKRSILSLARANGIPADDVYQMDASKQSKRVSANVSGMFGTLRITLNDNLLRRTSPAGIEAVMGHEMGHYVLNHVYEFIPYFALVILAGFGFLRWSFDRAVARWGAGWGVRGIADVAGLPLLAALLSVYFFVLTPLNNTFVRTNEAEADMFGLNASRQPDGFAEVALQLGEYRKLSPGPVEEWVFFDHPSGRNRILAAMRWKAEHPGGK